MIFAHSFVMALAALGVSAVPAPQTYATTDPSFQDQCVGVECPADTSCKAFDFGLEKPVACEAHPNATLPADVEQCGGVICPTGTFCCNSSCGVCAKPGDLCRQWFC
ncbi:hypothetical protein Cob_v004709 [Colletotrichum orbiculare MAFF 240422]|uniref:Uncharacterized protein n=3 Tax=Colletotrichum orbiculare species complex TaxID=2707354 RepID=A0A484FWX7_COLOR|nr:hypothetical protein Cob_v004709 [Colletotrichum orbiculare MAFF 240422]TDZ39597.1 hypothetical protein C8035_v005383 [Colletotrichum spinosum]TDZ47661.1 hypothetical protein CTRI78_v008507 [Colletotrichum trifolii]